jgi:glucose/arabinose dehydrogenase
MHAARTGRGYSFSSASSPGNLKVVAFVVVGVGAMSPGAPVAGEPSPFVDYRGQRPGLVHKITVADLPPPNATESIDNGPRVVPRPRGAWPEAPDGFRVDLYADGLSRPRLIRAVPGGDAFVAESTAGVLRVFRGVTASGRAARSEVFATGLSLPFGIAFYPAGPDPRWVYVANTGSVVRFPYRAGDLKARAGAQVVVPELPGGGLLRGGGHWTRDLAFSGDGKTLFVSVGSRSNADDTDDNPAEFHRAAILSFDVGADGAVAAKSVRVHASGIRNAVGIAVHPTSGELWASVNERDELGDNLVPDYITHVQPGGFYGWPFYYLGAHPQPGLAARHPELAARSIVPDVLLQPHNASLEMVFYDGELFPAAYRGDIFAAQHGSWNRRVRCGYQVVRVPMHGGTRATGEYQDFLTGFVTPSGQVWGRPVGVAVASDGALLVTDDGSGSIWRVSATGPR